MIMMLVVGIFVLAGCGENEAPSEPIVDEELPATVDAVVDNQLAEYLEEKYPLESEKIEIYSTTGRLCAAITDEADIGKLQESVKFEKWVKYDENQYEGILSMYVKFNDDTIIATYDNIPYGIVGTGPINIDTENLVVNVANPEGHFDMSEEFLQTVNQMVEKYSD